MPNILVNNATGRVVYVTDGPITLEEDRAVAPDRIFAQHNASNATVYTDVTPPTRHGGRYTYDGSTFVDTWPYKSLTRLEFITALQEHGGMSDADLVAARNDPNLAALWLKLELATTIERDSFLTSNGLATLVATGYLTEDERQAVVDSWERGRDDPR